MAKPHLPRFLYVKEEIDGATRYFVASEDYKDMAQVGEKVTIARYEKVGGAMTAEGTVKLT